jgi:hypothetical protein
VQVDPAELERPLDQAAGNPNSAGCHAKVVDQVPGVVCGQKTTLIVSDGTNSDG